LRRQRAVEQREIADEARLDHLPEGGNARRTPSMRYCTFSCSLRM
jgi:hypothetical protein